jgi:hypothetical protein
MPLRRLLQGDRNKDTFWSVSVNMRHSTVWSAVTVLACSFAAGSCGFQHEESGPTKRQEINLDRGNVDHADIELDLGAGQMNVNGGAQGLLNGTVQFVGSRAEPKVTDSVHGDHATITIQQPEHTGFGGNHHTAWDLRVNDQVITDLTLNCGAGQAQLDLGTLKLRSLNVHMGAGQVNLDLRGTPTQDYDVRISGGVGQAVVYLPQNVGVQAEANGGIGSISVSGLEKRGNLWQNALFDNSKVNVHVKVNGGIGEIRIIG